MVTRSDRARSIKKHGSIGQAVSSGDLSVYNDISVSEAIVLGLLNQGVRKYIGIFGHGSTDIAEVLRVYEAAGVVKTYNVRHETAAAHAATALKVLTGETAAVITSIGPGALQAFAGSLCSASNGAGVYYIFGDETTHGEGFNMQQIPREEQGLFLKICGAMGGAYSLYEPWSVITALRLGASVTAGPGFAAPFFLLAPMNVQPVVLKDFNLLELPGTAQVRSPGEMEREPFERATRAAGEAKRVAIKLGQGSRGCGGEIVELAELLDAAIIAGPSASGVVPASERRFMYVGGSKGSICGNYAMNEADLVIVVGARAVCQWDSSGTAWKKAREIINFNSEASHASHYNRTTAIVGDAKTNIMKWIAVLKEAGFKPRGDSSQWYVELEAKRKEWELFKAKRFDNPCLHDEVWKREVLTQPAAVRIACDFADSIGAVKIFDAGDVQANGFQLVEDTREGMTFTDTGSSYMGFASSAVLVSAMSDIYPVAFCGDGSFMMNPQILIDAVEHGARGCIVLFDNRRMAAISGLQNAQYGIDYATRDGVAVDYAAMARSVEGILALHGGYSPEEFRTALQSAAKHRGLSLVHVPVYYGHHELGGLGVYGDWNVGNWCERVQREHHRIGL